MAEKPVIDYVIFQDRWNGDLRWQGHRLSGIPQEDGPLPVAPPCSTRQEAILDCKHDWTVVQGKPGMPVIAPTDRQHPWTGNRRNL